MNREILKKIIDCDHPMWEDLLIAEISKDKRVIPLMLKILDSERETKDELLKDSNSELSRALVTILDENYGVEKGKHKAYIDRVWVAGKIKEHYLKWQEFITCNFKIEGLP